MPVVFIDRSNVNGSDDYTQAPVTHLYLKVTEGTTFVDSTYTARRQQGDSAGAKIGGYHFGRAQGDPVAQADFFLSKLGRANPGDLKPCLDLERALDGTTMSQAQAAAFVRRCKQKLGYSPVLYGSTSLIGPMRSRLNAIRHPLISRRLRACPWWRAEYGPNDGQRHPLAGGALGAAAHQYTSEAIVPGVSGRTDQSSFIAKATMIIPEPVLPFAVFKDGKHLRDFASRANAYNWLDTHHHPRKGHQIQIRHREK